MSAGSYVLGPDADGTVLTVDEGRITSCAGTSCAGTSSSQAGTVPAAGAAKDAPSSPAATARTIPCDGLRIVPGRVNAHTHIYSGLAPLGMPDPDDPPQSFVQILERVWWRLDRALDAATLRAAARLYVAESLLHGTTTLIDHHESPNLIEGSLDILADACSDLGMRAVLCYGATERNGGRDEARRGLEECRRLLRSNRRPLVRATVGLHASFTVSDETVREAGALCRDLGAVLHTHTAEDFADVQDAWHRGYEGPLERLLQLDAIPPGSILAHGVYLERAQVLKAAGRGCWIVQNPRSNRGNGVGYPKALKESRRVALGTDGYPSDMVEENQVLAEEAASRGDPREAVAARLPAGRDLAAERFGVSFSMQSGSAADIVIEGPEGPRHVFVDGRLVVEGGRLLTADLDEIRGEAGREAARLWKRLAEVT
jgi:cytosine/adenosine deaminase-related metal-dependent hydrolase